MNAENENAKTRFTVTAEEEKAVVGYSVSRESDAPETDEATGAAPTASLPDAGNKAPEAERVEAKSKEGIISIPANNTPKNYTKEYIYIALLTVLCTGSVFLAAYVPTYKFAGIILAALSALAALALVRHIFDCRKVRTLVSSGQCKTVTELMKAMKKTKRPEFLRTLGGIIRDGHLTDYAIVDDEYFAYRPAKNSDR